MCQLQDGTCANQNARHPHDQCLICAQGGKWIKQPRSKLVDDFGPTSLNIVHSNALNLEPVFSESSKYPRRPSENIKSKSSLKLRMILTIIVFSNQFLILLS